jgi:hypothetical protein
MMEGTVVVVAAAVYTAGKHRGKVFGCKDSLTKARSSTASTILTISRGAFARLPAPRLSRSTLAEKLCFDVFFAIAMSVAKPSLAIVEV